jgi:xylulokinase
MGYFLGIDLGTSYFKAALFEENGRLCGLGRQFVPKNTENGKTCELAVDDFWNTLSCCIKEAVRNANIRIGQILSISYSSQANSFILLDQNKEPLTPLILWPDERAEKIENPIDSLAKRNDFKEKTGFGITLSPQLCISKLMWFQNKQPFVWKRTHNIMLISDYLVYILTGHEVVDYNTASTTGLFEVKNRTWWNESLELLNIDPNFLSSPQKMGTYVGKLTCKGARIIGLDKNTHFYLGGLDHHVAAIGAGIPVNGNMCESTGTVLACVSYMDHYSPKSGCCTAPGLDENHFFQMAFNENGAISLEWYQKKYAHGFSIPELLEMASSVDIGSEGLIAGPCVNKFQGYEGFKNIKQSYHHGHFVRAILESTALSLFHILAYISDNEKIEGLVSVGGGANSRLWMEIKSNMIDTHLFIPKCRETACLGAAMLGAFGINKNANVGEVMNKWTASEEMISPTSDETVRYRDWKKSNLHFNTTINNEL